MNDTLEKIVAEIRNMQQFGEQQANILVDLIIRVQAVEKCLVGSVIPEEAYLQALNDCKEQFMAVFKAEQEREGQNKQEQSIIIA